MRILLLVLVLGGMLAFALVALVQRFASVGSEQISMHGWIAMAAGGALSLLLAGGLMFLTFYSARRGFDDRQRPDDPDAK